jgi:AraC-like DNA-binding protein
VAVFLNFLLTTIAVTYWTSFILLQDKRSNRSLNRWFAFFLIALTAPQIELYMATSGKPIFEISFIAASFLWLKGPFVIGFIRALEKGATPASSMWPHFVPWLIVLPTLFLKTEWFMPLFFAGMIHMLVYLIYAIWSLMATKQQLMTIWQGFQNTAYYWLLYIIVGLIVLIVLDLIVMSLINLGVLTSFNLVNYYIFPGFSVFVLSIAILMVYRPDMLFRANQEEIEPEPENPISKSRQTELDASSISFLTRKLNTLVSDKNIHLNNELSLAGLANELDITSHQASELLNVHLETSFHTFITGHRIEQACRLLSDPSCKLRIIDVAFESGFNNKNSFFRLFKLQTGQTPSAYRSLSRAQPPELISAD